MNAPRTVLYDALGLVLALSLFAPSPLAAQITTNTALQVPEGQGLIRLQVRLLRSTGDPTSMDRDLTLFAVPVVGVYGLNARLTLFGAVPFLVKELDVTTPQGRRERSTSGLGDARLFARYTILRVNRHGEMIRLAPLGGLKIPTGKDDQMDALGRLPPPLQLGSGSWDPFGGVTFTWQTFDWQLDLSPIYTFPTQANDIQFGDEIRLDASGKYRIYPRSLGAGVPGFLYAVLESNLAWQDNHEIQNRDDPDSGGTSWYLVPGLQYVTRRLVLEAGVQLPVVQDLNGRALERDFAAIISARMNF